MKIIRAYPPNFAAIKRAFRPGPGVVFSYGEFLFAPSGRPVPHEIIAHEEIHGQSQLQMGTEEWWARYVASPAFRLMEELLAHQAEFRALAKTSSSPSKRARFLLRVSAKLAAPLYGNLCTIAEAKGLIMGEHPAGVWPQFASQDHAMAAHAP